MGKTIKAAWDCEHCGKRDIPGDVRHCPGCGSPVGDNVKYHVPRVKEYVDEVVVPKGPDWECMYCGSYNRYETSICSNCGADKNGAKDYFGNTVSSQSDSAFDMPVAKSVTSDSSYHHIPETPEYESDSYYEDSASATHSNWRVRRLPSTEHIGMAAIILAVLALIGGIIYLAIPKEREFTVNDVSWSRTFYIEKYSTVHEEDWDVPHGARVTDSYLKTHHYDQVEDGTKIVAYTVQEPDGTEVVGHRYVDKGNGYMDEEDITQTKYKTVTKTRSETKYKDVAVKRTWYCYDIDKYVRNRTMSTGASDKEPYWPENPPVERPNPRIGDERIGSRSESYKVSGFVTNKPEKKKTYSLSQSDWEKINVGDTIRCKISTLTGHMTLIEYDEEEVPES